MKVSDWIKVEDRLPEDGVWVFISQQGGNVGLGQYVNGVWWDDMDCRMDVAPTYWMIIHYPENNDTEGYRNENIDVKEKSLPKDEPDYWEKLKHQYAGMAMQGIMSNMEMYNTITKGVWLPDRPAYIAERCDDYATALVNRLKEKEK